MIKIGISGKANSGKNTIAKLVEDFLRQSGKLHSRSRTMAFAEPVKKMAQVMFPNIPDKNLYGPSKYRSEIIENAFKDGNPLTVRQLLIDLGTGLGRSYNQKIWLDNFDFNLKKLEKQECSLVVVPDCRFTNELNFLKQKGFHLIRVLRDTEYKINHSSETEQDSIPNSEFHLVINNTKTLSDLKATVKNFVESII